jgi:hypothetical protein
MLPATKNIVLGSGRLYFDEFDADGNPQGERYVAETPGFSITAQSNSVEDFSSDGPTAEKHMDAVISVVRDATVGVKDISAENLAMFLMGDVGTQTTAGASVTTQSVNGGVGVQQGHWYQLGVTASRPAGVRDIASLVVEDLVPAAYTVDDDYVEDLENGRIYIVPGGGIANDTVLTVDYDEGSVSWDEVSSNDTGPKKGALRFIAGNTKGTNRDVFMTSVIMKPNGEFALKSRDTVQQMSFTVSVLKPEDGREALYVNGKAA